MERIPNTPEELFAALGASKETTEQVFERNDEEGVKSSLTVDVRKFSHLPPEQRRAQFIAEFIRTHDVAHGEKGDENQQRSTAEVAEILFAVTEALSVMQERDGHMPFCQSIFRAAKNMAGMAARDIMCGLPSPILAPIRAAQLCAEMADQIQNQAKDHFLQGKCGSCGFNLEDWGGPL